MWWYWMKKEWLFEISPENSEITCQNGVKQFWSCTWFQQFQISDFGPIRNWKVNKNALIKLNDTEWRKNDFEISPEIASHNVVMQYSKSNLQCKIIFEVEINLINFESWRFTLWNFSWKLLDYWFSSSNKYCCVIVWCTKLLEY